MTSNITTVREEFGVLLKSLRSKAGYSLRKMEQLTGCAYSVISNIEQGERAIGSGVAARLADALQLQGQDRDEFLIQAARTRKKDRLIEYARLLPAEVLNFLPMILQDAGYDIRQINGCSLERDAGQAPNAGSDRAGGEHRLILDINGERVACTMVVARN